MNPNFAKLAAGLTGFSTNLQAGERVLIDVYDTPEAMTLALVRAARERGAIPFVNLNNARINRELVSQLGELTTQSSYQSKTLTRSIHMYLTLSCQVTVLRGSKLSGEPSAFNINVSITPNIPQTR